MIAKGTVNITSIRLGASNVTGVYIGTVQVWPSGSQVIPVTAIAVSGAAAVNTSANSARYTVSFTPSGTTQTGITWSIQSGSAYASIDAYGTLTVKSGASGASVTIRATSTENASVYGEKAITVTYNSGIGVTASYPVMVTSSAQRVQYMISDPDNHAWSLWDTSGMLGSWISASGVLSGNATATGTSISGTGSAVVYFNITENTGSDIRNFTGLRLRDNTTNVRTNAEFSQDVSSAPPIPVTKIAIVGASTVDDPSNKSQYTVTYTPSNTTQSGVSWSVIAGSAYASIDAYGTLTVKSGASGASVTIKAVSVHNSSVYGTKTVTVTYSAPAVNYSLTVNPTPSDAAVSVTVDGVATAYSAGMQVPSGSTVKVTVSKTGYVPNTQTFTMAADRTLTVTLQQQTTYYSLTVNPTPSDATITVSVGGSPLTYSAGMLIAAGASVEVTVAKSGYQPNTQTFTISSDTTLAVSLDPVPATTHSLTVNVTPSDATMTLKIDDTATQYTPGMQVAEGAAVQVTASKANYVTQTVTTTMTSDKTISITLALVKHSLTVNATPSGALIAIKVNGSFVAYSAGMLVTHGDSVEVTVSKQHYVSDNQTFTMVEDKTLSFTLTRRQYFLTINPTPSGATIAVTVNGQPRTYYPPNMVITSESSVTVAVSMDGYTTDNRSFSMTSDKALNIALQYNGIALESISILGASSVHDPDNYTLYGVTYQPSDTGQTGVSWSITSGAAYASIDSAGKLTVDPSARADAVTIKATSVHNPAIYATKNITVTYYSLQPPEN